jgi:phosphinothricin acetyltransferase
VSEPAIRPARPGDAEAMAAIFREGIEDRVATFQTVPASAAELAALTASGRPVLVAERGAEVVGWAKVAAYTDAHDYYATVGEATLYVARGARRTGVGAALLTALATAAEQAGYHKLVGKVMSVNGPSIGLLRRCGWREVGVHLRHSRLDGAWHDVIVVELLLGEAGQGNGDDTG